MAGVVRSTLTPTTVKQTILSSVKFATAQGEGAAHAISTVTRLPFLKCDHCGGKHPSNSCWTKYPEKAPKAKAKGKVKKGKGKQKEGGKKDNSNNNVNNSASGSGSNKSAFSAYIRVSFGSATEVLENHQDHAIIQERGFLQDSGCTNNVSSYPEDFYEIDYNHPLRGHITVADGSRHASLGVGTIKVRSHGEVLEFRNVIYNPHVKGRYLSASPMDRAGYTWVIRNGLCQITDAAYFESGGRSGKVFMEGRNINGLYWFVPDEILKPPSLHTASKPESTYLWHKRFGHASERAVRRLPTQVEGVPTLYKDKGHPICDGCLLGKQHKRHYPESTSRKEEVLDMVHMDIMGPFPVESVKYGSGKGGNSYAITFLDDHSSVANQYYLAHKSEALDSFKKFKARVELETGKRSKYSVLIGLRSLYLKSPKRSLLSMALNINYRPPMNPNRTVEQNGLTGHCRRRPNQCV